MCLLAAAPVGSDHAGGDQSKQLNATENHSCDADNQQGLIHRQHQVVVARTIDGSNRALGLLRGRTETTAEEGLLEFVAGLRRRCLPPGLDKLASSGSVHESCDSDTRRYDHRHYQEDRILRTQDIPGVNLMNDNVAFGKVRRKGQDVRLSEEPETPLLLRQSRTR